jgi:hypothetical protein
MDTPTVQFSIHLAKHSLQDKQQMFLARNVYPELSYCTWDLTKRGLGGGGLPGRCINAVIVASEWVRAERKELRRQGQVSAEPGSKSMHGESAAASSAETQGDVEVAIKTAFTKFLQSAVATVLESWDDLHRLVVPIQKLAVLTSH